MKSNLLSKPTFLLNMLTAKNYSIAGDSEPRFLLFPWRLLLLVLALGLTGTTHAAPAGKIYSNPDQAVAALRGAVTAKDTNALGVIFGTLTDLQNPDRVQAENDLEKFSTALVATNHLVRVSETNLILEVGNDLWPFPIPIVRNGEGWSFDAAAGREEIVNRRIGRNELSVLEVMRAYVNAQREYASKDRDGDGVLEYAQKIASSPGKTDGLYWPVELNGELSPLGPLAADARVEGYRLKKSSSPSGPQPFHGYFFKILTRQGKHAPGGAYDYIINGNMIGGFAMVAWPVEYGDSGVMTFIVNQQGRVYQKDLGTTTSRTVEKMKAYDPDSTWKLSPD